MLNGHDAFIQVLETELAAFYEVCDEETIKKAWAWRDERLSVSVFTEPLFKEYYGWSTPSPSTSG